MGVNVLIFTDCSSRVFARSSGAYRIATELREAGYTVQVIDNFLLMGLERTLAIIDKFIGPETLFVGFSSTFMNGNFEHIDETRVGANRFKLTGFYEVKHQSSVTAISYGIPLADDDLQALKDAALNKNSKVKFVLGGAKASNRHYQPQIDTFIVGYADTTVIQYARFLEGKNPFFQANKTPSGQLLVDSDINAEGFDFKNSRIRYHESDMIEPHEVLPIEVSRGCIFKCKFCAFQLTGKKKLDYIKDCDVLYDELMFNYREYGVTKYIFSDDTYNDSVEKLQLLSETFKRLPFESE